MVGFKKSGLERLYQKAAHLMVLTLVSVSGYGQLVEYMVMGSSGKFQPAPYTQPYDSRYQGVKGNPLLFDTWTKCNVYNDSFLFLEEVMLNYDMLNQHLLILGQGNKVYSVQAPFYTSILDFQGRAYLLKPYELEGFEDEEQGVIEVLGTSNRLFVFRRKKFIQADYKGGYSAGRDFDEYVEEKEYYLKDQNGSEFQKIKLSSSSLKKALSEAEWNRVETMIEENNLKLDNEMTMIYVMQGISE